MHLSKREWGKISSAQVPEVVLYLHVPVWMGQKGSRFREICTSLRGAGVNFPSSDQVPEVVMVDVLNTVKLFIKMYIICVVQWNGSYLFHPIGQNFFHINMTSEKPSEVSGNCGVLP